MSNFKIGDIIQPKAELRKRNERFYAYYPLDGKVVDILGTAEKRFPVIENKDGTLFTVNPDLYEKVEDKEKRT